MLYSHNNNYPAELPHTIILSNGMVRSVASTFTQEEIDDAGYVAVEDPPTISDTETLRWGLKDGVFQWIVEQISSQEMWGRVIAERNRRFAFADERLAAIQYNRKMNLPVNSIDYENKLIRYIGDLMMMEHQGNPFEIQWPMYPHAECHLGVYPSELFEEWQKRGGPMEDIFPIAVGWSEFENLKRVSDDLNKDKKAF